MAASGCNNDPQTEPNIEPANEFDDPHVQQAYEACVHSDFKLTLHQNPKITQATFDRIAPQSLKSCKIILAASCVTAGRDSQNCNDVIGNYIDGTVKLDGVEVKRIFRPWWKFW